MRLQPVATTLALAAASAMPSSAQSLGTFRWQLQPYCNVVTVTITQTGGVYRLEGTDDQCGAGRDKAAVQGLAFPNPDGTIGFGLTTVTAPGGVAVHVDADITLATLSGTWRDSANGTGTFAFTSGPGSGGSPRPVPTAVPSSVLLLNAGAIPPGTGSRMVWHAARGAFRAGLASGTPWDETNIGGGSVAFGRDTIASAEASTAMGNNTVASGAFSVAFGEKTIASGSGAASFGLSTAASGTNSLAMGLSTTATGRHSFAGGERAAAGDVAFGFGYEAKANGPGSVALGTFAYTAPVATGSFAFSDGASLAPFGALGPGEFNARFANGYQFYTNAAASLGAWLKKDATAWTVLSDVNAKHHFRELDRDDVLQRIARMPVTEWSYKAQAPGVRHIGPTAQDFYAAFGLGSDRLGIETLDADGVALAGVKALEARTRELPERVRALEAENEALRERLERLERLLAPK